MASSNPSQRPWRAGSIFIICVCCAPECQCLLGTGGGALHRAGVLVFMSSTMVFAATAKGHPLTIRLWWPGRLAFLGPMGLWQSEKWMVVGRLLPTGLCTDSRLRHIPCLSVKESSVCPRALAWGTGFTFSICLVDYRATPKECRLWMPLWCSPSVFCQLTSIFHKRTYTLV